MADYIFIRKSRNILSSFLHISLNLILGLGSIYLTYLTGSWVLGIILVVLSKWRMFAIRPRFWLTNIKSSLVDLIVGASFVLIAYCSGTELLPVHYLLGLSYSLWLILLKPRSSEAVTELQALVSIFLGTTAATLMTANANAIWLTVACYLIGYSAARHVLIQTNDHDYSLVTIAAGLIAAEIAWFAHSWLIVYPFGTSGIIIPQLSIILSLLGFAFGCCYKASLKDEKGELKFPDVAMPVLFSALIISIILIWFSEPIFNV